MATFANYFLPNPPTTTTSTSRQTHASLIVPNTTSGSTTTTNKLSSNWSSNFFTKPRLLSLNHHHHHAPSVITPRSTAPSSSSSGPTTSPPPQDERVKRIHSISEFDEALRLANNKLVVVEFATAKSLKSEKTIYPFMVSLSRTCNDVAFLLVVCDESDRTRALSRRELEPIGVDLEAQQLQSDTGVAAPHFSFYKNGEKVHDESSVGTEQLVGDVLYYGDSHSAVVQLHGREDVEKLMEEHKKDGKLIVLDVGLKHCGPCVKVYPTVIKLSRQMEDLVVFARMNGDENESCMKFMKEMDVVEVPTFLFIRDGRVKGRYVGSGKGELIGEILRYQGVRVTY